MADVVEAQMGRGQQDRKSPPAESYEEDFYHQAVDMSPDAAWRREAAERIDRHRKADLTVRVVNASGEPVAGREVHFEMTRHAFRFGTAVNVPLLLRVEGGHPYRERLVELFNVAAPENYLKRFAQTDEEKRAMADQAVDWLLDRGLDIHGHVLVWNHKKWSGAGKETEAALQRGDRDVAEREHQFLLNHARTTTERYSGRVTEWDVLNEPFEQNHLSPVRSPGVEGWQAPELREWFGRRTRGRPRRPALY